MGIIRKTMSVSTMGLIDFRSDKERTARYTRQTRSAVRAQSKMQSQLAAQQMQAQYQQAAWAQQQAQAAAARLAVTQYPAQQPQQIPPGWYQNPQVPGRLQWWDGLQWAEQFQPLLPPGQ